jgi:transcriptional antiterminator RfaH
VTKISASMDWTRTESSDSALAWYCARTHPKHEHIAARSLNVRLGLEVFHPRLRMERSTRRGVVRVIEPLFPCYVFVRCRLEEQLDAIRYVTGISSLVHFNGKIPLVPDEVVDELRDCFEAEEPMAISDRIKPGSEVIVSEGAFLGARGIVVKNLPARERVEILLEFLGRTTLAEVERKSVRVEDLRLADLMPALAAAGQMELSAAA